MKAKGNLKLKLVYCVTGKDILIGEVDAPEILSLTGQRILEEAKARADMGAYIDPVLKIETEAELYRKRRALRLLLGIGEQKPGELKG
jgi:hypothetical protein